MIAELLELARRLVRRTLPASSSGDSRSSGLDDDVLDRYPIELSGGMKQRMVMVHLDAAQPVAADRGRDHLGARRVDPEGGRRDARRVPRPGVRQEHDRRSPTTSRSSTRSPTRSLVMYAGKLVEKAPTDVDHGGARAIRTRSSCISSLPEVGVRFAEQRLTGIPGRAAVAARPADRLPLPGPLPAGVREVRRGAAVRRDRAGPLRRLLEGGT